MKKYSKSILIFLILFGIGYGVGRYTTPEKVRTEIVEKEVVKKDVVTVIKEIVNKDGTKTTETIIKDKSQSQTDSLNLSETTYSKSKYKINAMVGSQNFDFVNPVYGLMVQKRFIGPFFLGAYGTNKKDIGLTVGFEF